MLRVGRPSVATALSSSVEQDLSPPREGTERAPLSRGVGPAAARRPAAAPIAQLRRSKKQGSGVLRSESSEEASQLPPLARPLPAARLSAARGLSSCIWRVRAQRRLVGEVVRLRGALPRRPASSFCSQRPSKDRIVNCILRSRILVLEGYFLSCSGIFLVVHLAPLQLTAGVAHPPGGDGARDPNRRCSGLTLLGAARRCSACSTLLDARSVPSRGGDEICARSARVAGWAAE